MKILAIQLKRIGDLVLTAPALAAMKALPNAEVVLAVHASTAGLLPAIPHCDSTIVFGPGRGWTPWQQVLTGGFDVALDFTGTDRSALATFFARARRRIAFDWTRKNRLRALPYNELVSSNVRERHTVDHYLDLVAPLGATAGADGLRVPESAKREVQRLLAEEKITAPYAVLHPFTARTEKNWQPGRWAEVMAHCFSHGLRCVITGGKGDEEFLHHCKILQAYSELMERNPPGFVAGDYAQLDGKTGLIELAALIRDAALVVSCDTAAVHLAAAFQRPQIALFGPTNPFHWRPRHDRAVVVSAAQPDAPMTEFNPRMKGAPMDRISTAAVCRAIDGLLAS